MMTQNYLLFTLDDQPYAVCIEAVERVFRAVELTRVPDAPDILAGLLNVHGLVVPVVHIRTRLGLPPHALSPEDRIILCKTSEAAFAMVVDRVEGIVELSEGALREPAAVLPGMEDRLEGVGVVGDQTVLVYRVDRLFPPEAIVGLEMGPDNGPLRPDVRPGGDGDDA